jgi:hypothetical protein
MGSKVPPLVAILALMLLVPLSGCEEAPNVSDEQESLTEEEYIVITLDSPNLVRRTGDAGDTWDVTLDILDLTPPTAMARWIELSLVVKGFDGSVLIPATPLSKDSGLYGVDPEVWYQEVSGNEERATVGDGFRITSMTRDFEGATVQVVRQGEILATSTLPTTFW